MKKLFLICCLSHLSFGLLAQDDIREIKEYYSELMQTIEETEKHSGEYEFVQYYVVKITENIHGMSMPAVGNYSGITEKWYASDEENYGINGNLVYQRSSFKIAAREELSEYIFNDGKLIFCYISTAGVEYRYYFKNDHLIKFIEKKGEDDFNYYDEDHSNYLLKRVFD